VAEAPTAAVIDRWPPGAVAVYAPNDLPALLFVANDRVVNLSHPALDASALSRVEARLALALIEHATEVLRAAHSLR
jgi:hypothetical protein